MTNQGIYLACSVFLLLGVCGVTADREEKVGGITLNVAGRSGKIKMGRGKRMVMINMDEMTEYNIAGDVVGSTGRRKHSFKSFATQDFTFSALQETVYQKLNCKYFDFDAYMAGPNATLKVRVYLFKQAGTIEMGKNETDEIKIGVLKWSIEIKNWEFCNGTATNCRKGGKDEIGDHLDFAIAVQSGKPPKRGKKRPAGKTGRKRPKNFELDDEGTELGLSQEVRVDGEWVPMAEDFPKFEQKRNKNIFTFRFPKFNSSLFYDPTLTMGGDGDSSSAPTVCLSTFLLASLLTLTSYVNLFN